MKEKKKEYREEIIKSINEIENVAILNYIKILVDDIKQEVQHDE